MNPRELLGNGEIESALSLMLEIALGDSALSDDITILLSRLRQSERQGALGTLTPDALTAQRAQITQGALRLARQLEPALAARERASASLTPVAVSATPFVATPVTAVPVAQPRSSPLRVFVSYAHEETGSPTGTESIWLDALLVHLRPLQREGLLDVWSDRQIARGASFDRAIRQQLESADVAILLVSPRFLASEYVYNTELPILLTRRQRAETTFYVLVLEHCDLGGTRYPFSAPDIGAHELTLASIQAMHSPRHPLAGMARSEAEAILARLASELRALAGSAAR
jgi:hypothetical protein